MPILLRFYVCQMLTRRSAKNQIHTQCPSVYLHCLVAQTQHPQLLNQASNRKTVFTTVLSAFNNPHLDTNHHHPCSIRSRDNSRPTRFRPLFPIPLVVPTFLCKFPHRKLSPSVSRFSTRKNRKTRTCKFGSTQV